MQSCAYGTLPGRWAKDDRGTYRWSLFDPNCQLMDYITNQVTRDPRKHCVHGRSHSRKSG